MNQPLLSDSLADRADLADAADVVGRGADSPTPARAFLPHHFLRRDLLPGDALATTGGYVGIIRDVVTLAKPRITAMVVVTALGGMVLAARYYGLELAAVRFVPALVGIAMVVAGANALNMFIERDTDALMARTRNRPLPAGRLRPDVALAFGVSLSVASLPWLALAVNPLTAGLAALALVSYVLVYTPLKRKTTLSLPIGAVPGAIPPILGWTAVAGVIDIPGLLLFGVLFLWQIPHFLAIATFRKGDYQRAGLKVLPAERGERVTRHHIVRYLAALILVSLLLVTFGVGGPYYLPVALVLGLVFFGVGAWGLRPSAGPRWARVLFITSLVYLLGVFAAIMS
jgi:heme o synthase